MDAQATKIYCLETTLCKEYPQLVVRLSLDEARSVVYQCCDHFNTPNPEITPGAENQLYASTYYQYSIAIPYNARLKYIAVHEAAHAINSSIHGLEFYNGHSPSKEAHGSNFVGIYFQLLSKFMEIPMNVLVDAADKDHIKIT